MVSIVAWTLGAVAAMLLAGLLYERIRARNHPGRISGRLVDVGGRAVHLIGKGHGTPTIVLEAGGGSSSLTSRDLQDRLSAVTRVCAYDRAGFGASDPVGHPRTFEGLADDLWRALREGGEVGPYILLGESMGGLVVRRFHAAHPKSVAGMILLDAAEELHTFARLDRLESMRRVARAAEWVSQFGILRLLLRTVPNLLGIPRSVPKGVRKRIASEYGRPGHFRATALELHAYASTPPARRLAGGFGHLGSTPLIVVRHGRPFTGSQEFLEDGWREAQERLASLSSQSRLVVARKSGHAVSLDQPGLVVDLAGELVRKVRAG